MLHMNEVTNIKEICDHKSIKGKNAPTYYLLCSSGVDETM